MFIVATSVALLAACAKDNPDGNDSFRDDGGATELTLNAARQSFTWTEGEDISVFYGGNVNAKFGLINGVGMSDAKFTGTVPSASGSYVALHPYLMSASYNESDGELRNVLLKSEQTAVAGNIDPEAAVLTAVGSKLGSTLVFKDAVGYVKLSTDFACTKITLASDSSTDPLAGTMDISLSLSGVPTVTARPDESVSQVSLTGTIEADNVYYIAVSPVTISGGYRLIFTLADGSEKRLQFSDELIISKGIIVDLGKLRFDRTPYVTFSAKSNQMFKMSLADAIDGLEYSLNNGDWTEVVSGKGVAFGGSDGELRLRGKSKVGTAISNVDGEYCQISFGDDTSPVTVSGDIRTLIDWENYETVSTADARFCYLFSGCSSLDSTLELPAMVLAQNCYEGMFQQCTSLEMVPELPATNLSPYCYYSMFSGSALKVAPKLPATNLVEHCYYCMFTDCTSLEVAPELPATTLSDGCYGYMFSGCISLKVAPKLPATTLAESCYFSMFKDCTSLTDAPPALPAATLVAHCYYSMFSGCNSLKVAPELAATTLTSRCYMRMFEGCTSLTDAPSVLPATTLTEDCYCYMFNGCTSLKVAPKLPAKVLAEGCYYAMFNGCTSLKDAPELPATMLADNCYYAMFNGCKSLKAAPELPATELKTECYEYMFMDCSSLVSAPSLPATTLAQMCYSAMFAYCYSLKSTPALPATKLETGCYNSMFVQCINLESAPELPAETLAPGCYCGMFNACSNLKEVTIKATDASADSALYIWLSGVASTGTIHKSAKLELPIDSDSGIPKGWTVVNDVTD